MRTNMKTMTNSPAAETAAAVRAPEIAATTVNPARMIVTTSIKTAPRGVLTTSVIDPLVPIFSSALLMTNTLSLV